MLSFDHKPQHDRERKRIEAAGGFVENFRVNGNLALSRAFGDFSFKKNSSLTAEEQIVTGEKTLFVCSSVLFIYITKRTFLYIFPSFAFTGNCLLFLILLLL